MAKDLKEQIEIMTHYLNGGDVEYSNRESNIWSRASTPVWDWRDFDYRIKKPKQKVTIEKWLCSDKTGKFVVVETSKIEEYEYIYKKVSLLESYEIEL